MDLKTAREALGWAQTKLDAKAGLTPGTTQQIESGRIANPSWRVVDALTRALQRAGLKGVTAHDLFPSDAHAGR